MKNLEKSCDEICGLIKLEKEIFLVPITRRYFSKSNPELGLIIYIGIFLFFTENCEFDPNGNRISPSGAGGAVAMMAEEASAEVEADDEIQEVTVESPDLDLVVNNTLIPELFSRANNATKRTGHFR